MRKDLFSDKQLNKQTTNRRVSHNVTAHRVILLHSLCVPSNWRNTHAGRKTNTNTGRKTNKLTSNADITASPQLEAITASPSCRISDDASMKYKVASHVTKPGHIQQFCWWLTRVLLAAWSVFNKIIPENTSPEQKHEYIQHKKSR